MTKNIIALSFIFLIKISFSQSKSDIAFFQNLNKEVRLINYNIQKDKKTSYGFFSFYKRFISSQDSGNCNFYPSCSVFGTQSIQKLGLFKGFLNTFDRLNRCNGINRSDYPIHPLSNLLYDPVL